MLLELTKPVALVLCMAALCAVFYTAFIDPACLPDHTIWDTLTLLSLAAGVCAASGMLFREDAGHHTTTLTRTLPMQMFLWTAGIMTLLYTAAWFLETHCVFYRDVRRL